MNSSEEHVHATISEQIAAKRKEQLSIVERFEQGAIFFAEAQQLVDHYRRIERQIAELRACQFKKMASLILSDAEPHEAPSVLDVQARLRQFAELLAGQWVAEYPLTSIREMVDQLEDRLPA